MTLVLAIAGKESIWLLTDRRLSAPGRSPRDGARKILVLETSDGVALLGYTGLGLTKAGTEPSEWMKAVLRGRNLPMDTSIRVLAEAMGRQLPPHMLGMPAHAVIAPAFLDHHPRQYAVELITTNPPPCDAATS
jgi:hypothetical protein